MLPVAVCCSSDSFVSLNSRAFSIAMTAWSAKVWRCHLALRERPDLSTRDADDPDAQPVAEHRDKETLPEACSRCPGTNRYSAVTSGTFAARHSEDGSADKTVSGSTAWKPLVVRGQGIATEVVVGDDVDEFAVIAQHYAGPPPHGRTALLTIASKTGCTSVGEPEIARRISAAAVRCSRASVSASGFRPRSSDLRMTAW